MKLNALLFVFVAIYVLQLIFFVWMERLNRLYRRQAGNEVPDSFEGFIDEEKLARINEYSAENSRAHVIQKVVLDALLLGLILTGFIKSFDFLDVSLGGGIVLSGLAFFAAVGALFFVLELPFSYYDTFVIEEKYGFNKSDFKTWFLDHVKGAVLSVVILIVVLGPLLWTIRMFPNYSCFWGFVVVSGVQFLMMVLYPVLIAPLFNKFEPLEDRDLADEVMRLAEKVGMKTSGIYQMDAGRRSTHSNAYFTGLGRTKRIVLFDTLLNSHKHDEILGVLAHEMGHFKLKHVIWSYLFSLVGMFAGLYLTYLLVNWNLLYETFGFDPGRPYLALFVVAIFWQKAGYFLKPIIAGLCRRFERQADAFAVDLLKNPEPLVTALKKMASHNLSNLNPHPFYVWFYYSHPPMVERVTRLTRSV
jgi:STE24 endopeptidase